jgi:hypothetical protein
VRVDGGCVECGLDLDRERRLDRDKFFVASLTISS